VVVTGATSGIGEAMARSFLDLGATVHLLGRNPDKVADYARELRTQVPNADVVEEVCDVADLDAVRAWCADLAGRVPAIHGLVHNAGAMPPERTESPQGHETTLACHVLGPHLMTSLLRDLLVAGPASVVWMSSGGMYGAGLHAADADDLEFRRGEYDGVQAYARTKRMQVVLADAWAETLRGTGVLVESMHPGWATTPGVTASLPRFDALTRRVQRHPAALGAGPLLARPPAAADHLRVAAPRGPGPARPAAGLRRRADRRRRPVLTAGPPCGREGGRAGILTRCDAPACCWSCCSWSWSTSRPPTRPGPTTASTRTA
jgi:NAD(P)-dependent dehydrogenase (short-subunit alcohol dehydrogenase family)